MGIIHSNKLIDNARSNEVDFGLSLIHISVDVVARNHGVDRADVELVRTAFAGCFHKVLNQGFCTEDDVFESRNPVSYTHLFGLLHGSYVYSGDVLRLGASEQAFSFGFYLADRSGSYNFRLVDSCCHCLDAPSGGHGVQS